MKKKLHVLIPDGDDGNIPLTVLRCLGQVPDVKVSVLCQEKWPPIRFSRYRSGFFSHGIDSFDRKRADAIIQAAKQAQVDIVLAAEQATIRLIGEYRNEVEAVAILPPTPLPELVDTVSSKWFLAEFLEKESIPYPSTILYQNEKAHEQDLTSLRFPVLTKPLDGYGGEGIIYFDEPSKLSEYLKSGKHPEKFIVQNFIRGYDIDCSVLCQNGEILAYTIQKAHIPGKKPFQPAMSIEFLRHEQVYDVIQRLMRALKWSGVAHIDLRYDEIDNTPKIIEINPRYWGSLMGSLAAGINFPYLACLTAMKIDFPKPKYQFIRFSTGESIFTESPFGKGFFKKHLPKDNTSRAVSTNRVSFALRDPLPSIMKRIHKT